MAFTIGYIGLGAQALSTVIGAFGARKVTKYNNAIAQAQADIARINAKQVELQANQRLFNAESEYQQMTMQAAQTKARQEVALAANGVAIGVGSAAEQRASTDIIKRINLNRLESNAKSDAWGYKSKATDYENQALMSEARKQSASSVFTNTLLSGIGQMGMAYGAAKLYSLAGTETTADKPEVRVVDDVALAEQRKNVKVDAISRAQPAFNGNLLLSGQYVPGQKFVSLSKSKYSPFYGVN